MTLDEDVDHVEGNLDKYTRVSGKARAVLYTTALACLISSEYNSIKFDHGAEVSPFYAPDSDSILRNIIITATVVSLLEVYARLYPKLDAKNREVGATPEVNITPNMLYYFAGGLYGVYTALNVMTNYF